MQSVDDDSEDAQDDEMRASDAETTNGPNNVSNRDMMRLLILKYLGCNNVLVGFHVKSTLAAPQLQINASRVVDMSVEAAFYNLVVNLEQIAHLPGTTIGPSKLFAKQKAPFDRRWPVVLFENGFELRDTYSDNVYTDSIYTAAVWRAEAPTVIESRNLGDVQRVKALYSVGGGSALNTKEHTLCDNCTNCVRRDKYGSDFTITATPRRDEYFDTVVPMHCDKKLLVYHTNQEI